MNKTSGKFITIEGQDGAGKSTNLEVALASLQASNIDVVVTREPGGTPLGEKLRSMVLSSTDQDFGSMAELLLIFAARAQHIEEVIQPALEAGKWVLCDRFTDATFAYQGGGRGLDTNKIIELELLVQGKLQPDLTLLLDVQVEIGEQRAGMRSAPDRFERQQSEFKARVRQTYLERAEAYPQRFRIVDAGNEIETVKADVSSAINDFVTQNI